MVIKEPSTSGRCITPKSTSKRKGILKKGISNKPYLSGSPLSKSGSYLSTLEKSKFLNDGLDFHCSFETDGSSEQDIDIPSTQPVSHEKILEGTVYKYNCMYSHNVINYSIKRCCTATRPNVRVSLMFSGGGQLVFTSGQNLFELIFFILKGLSHG